MMPPPFFATRVDRSAPPPELPGFVVSVGGPARRSQVLRGEIARLRLLLTRYALEAAASLAGFAGMFLVFAYLGSVMQGRLSPFDTDPRVLAVLYLAWMIVTTAVGGCTNQLAADAATGVLESLFLTATPLARILEMRALAHALHGVAMSAILLVAFCLGTHWWPSPVVLVTLAACVVACTLTALGLALALSGAALLSKRVGALMMPVNFLCMIALMGGPAREIGAGLAWTAGLPFVAAAGAVRIALRDNVLALHVLAIALLGALPWLLIGRAVLARCIVACRRRGSTHTY
jgi:hypothetical protein